MALNLELLFCIYNESNDTFLNSEWIWIDSRFGTKETIVKKHNEIKEKCGENVKIYSLQELFSEYEGAKRTKSIQALFDFIEEYNSKDETRIIKF